jgi:hypothetical protein
MSEQGEQTIPTIPEVILSSAALLVSLSARATAEGDLDAARLGIDALAAQLPLIERVVPAEALTQYRQALADLQLGYAQAIHQPAKQHLAAESEPTKPPRPKIWTPGGDV